MHGHLKRSNRTRLTPALALVMCLGAGGTGAEQPSRAVYPTNAVAELKGFNFRSLRLAIADLSETFGAQYASGAEFLRQLDALEKALTNLSAPSGAGAPLVALLDRLKALKQKALLANPLLDFDQLLLVRRHPANLGLPANWQGNSSLPRSGFDNEIALLAPVAPGGGLATLYKPDGGKFVGDLKLHFEAGRLLFSSIGTNGRWQVFELELEQGFDRPHPGPLPQEREKRIPSFAHPKRSGVARTRPTIPPLPEGAGRGEGKVSPAGRVRQITPGDQSDVDNFDACYLPDGRIIFCSTAGFTGVPCVDGSDHVSTLYLLERDGKTIRQLCFDQDHNWSPTMRNDGRVLYQRWEYADVPHSNSRLLFQMNPDGTGQEEFYGSNSYWPNAMFYARPIPGHPTKVVAIVSGHHGVPRMGEMVIFDPARGRQEADGVVQRIPGFGKKVEPIYRDQLVDDSWPKFLHPFPLSEKYFLVSAKPAPNAHWGIYLVDVFDNLLLLAELPGHALFEPVPLRQTPKPPVIPDRIDLQRKDALVYLTDIYQGEGLKGVPRGTVKALRVFAYHWAYQGMGGLLGTIGLDGPWDVRRILGTVPVEADGSAYFRVPANTPLSVQPLDAEGRAVQLMRSWFTAMPGENLSCVGCHERQNTAPASKQATAFQRRVPSEINPWHGPPRGFSFKREVQPVLDEYCVSCHDGKTPPDLRGAENVSDFKLTTPGHAGQHGGKFSVGYANLHRYVRRPGIESDYHLLTPMEYHADTTELVQLLKQGHHGVRLHAESWDRLVTWIDLNAPYHGTWHEEICDPGRQRTRRNELRKLYAGMEDDGEVVPSLAAAEATRPASEIQNPKSEIRNQPNHLAPSPPTAGWPFNAAEAARQQAAAGSSSKRTVDLGGGLKLEMVLIPAGEFVMGDANASPDEQPLARVRIAKAFWMGRVEVSNEQFTKFDAAHDSHVESKTAYQFGIHGIPLNELPQPVVRVSWERAMGFCQWLSRRTGQRFSLPTEAQWEYACRAGSATTFSFGDASADFSGFANLADAKLSEFASDPYTICKPLDQPTKYEDYIPKDTRWNDGGLVTVRVGSYQPNPWGLHDMHGNVWEWTRSSYRLYPYQDSDGRNNLSPAEKKVVRGGSWRDRPFRATSAYRLAYEPWQAVFNVGFRVVCETGTEVAHDASNRGIGTR